MADGLEELGLGLIEGPAQAEPISPRRRRAIMVVLTLAAVAGSAFVLLVIVPPVAKVIVDIGVFVYRFVTGT